MPVNKRKKNFHGLDGFVWWHGVVEDRFDPLFLGRCKVRIFGFDQSDKSEQPTKSLPWAYPSVDLDSGRNVVGPKEGDWVWGFFRDGENAQQPVMIGVIWGISEEVADPSRGFFDPRPDSLLTGHKVPREPEKLQQYDDGSGNDIEEEKFKSRWPEDAWLMESQAHRYPIGWECGHIDKTVVPEKIKNIDIGQRDVPTAHHPPGTGSDITSKGGDWTEAETAYNAEYPYNHVYFSEGGHFIEIDDSPNFERMHWYHRVGTFKEWSPLGGEVTKIVDNEWHIVLEKRFTHIEAAELLTVDWGMKVFVNKDREAGFNYDLTVGDKGHINLTTEGGKLNIHIQKDDMNVKVEKEHNTETDDDSNTTNHINRNLRVDGDWNIEVRGNCNITVLGNVNQVVTGNTTLKSIGSTNVYAVDGCSLTTENDVVATINGDLNANVFNDMTAHVQGSAFNNIEGNLRETVKGSHYRIVDGDYREQVKGKYELIVDDDMTTVCLKDMVRDAKGRLMDTSELACERHGKLAIIDETEYMSTKAEFIVEEATALISETAANITMNAAIIGNNTPAVNCSGALFADLSTYAEGGSGAAAPIPGPAPLPTLPITHPADATIHHPVIQTIIVAFINSVPSPIVKWTINVVPFVKDIAISIVENILGFGEADSNPSNNGAAADGTNDQKAESETPGITSNSAEGTAAGVAGGAGGGGGGGAKAPVGPSIGAPDGFLWKPFSEGDGNLVVLLPSDVRGGFATITLADGTSVDGRFTSVANGGREHYRFPQGGDAYSGATISTPVGDYTINDGSLRYEGGQGPAADTSTDDAQ